VLSALQSVIPQPAYTGASHFEADYNFSDVNEFFDTDSLADIPGYSQAATITSLSSQTRFRKTPTKARAKARNNPNPRARRPILSQAKQTTNPTAAFYDSSDDEIMQGGHELEYISTLEREAFVEAQYQHLCCMPKKQSDDAEYLERQTEECIRTAHLTPVQAGKVRKLRAGKAKAIRANTAMSNAAMSSKNFASISDILLRIIAITQVLAKDGESHEARAKLETIHEDTVQDTDRAEDWIPRFGAYFDMSNTHQHEFQHYERVRRGYKPPRTEFLLFCIRRLLPQIFQNFRRARIQNT